MPAVDYDTLARFYDSLATSDEDVPFFVDFAKRAEGPVLELMAGTGRVSLPVARQGVALTCVDSSPAMLAELRRKLAEEGTSAVVVRQDVTKLDLKTRFALAFLAFNSFEELIEDDDRRHLLRRTFTHLRSGGRFLCTLHDPEVRLREVGRGHDKQWRFADTAGRKLLLRLRTTFEHRRSLVRGYQALEDLATGETLADLPLCFRLTSRDEFRSLAGRAGFGVEALYGDYVRGRYRPGRSASMVWVLRRA